MSYLSGFVESMFFRNDNRTYWMPHHFGLASERLSTSTGGVSILILRPGNGEGQLSKGTILYFHPAQFNMSYNLIQVGWLADKGYTIVLFDYRGCGKSQGEISFASAYEDAELVHKKISEEKIAGANTKELVLFGQGIGADTCLHFYRNHKQEVSAVILESAYATQSGWLKDRYGPVIGDLAAKLHQSQPIQPQDVISSVTCPLLIIEPEKDDFIRDGERKKVRKIAPEHAVFWRVLKKRYLGVFAGNLSDWHKQLEGFISEALEPAKLKKEL